MAVAVAVVIAVVVVLAMPIVEVVTMVLRTSQWMHL